MNALPSGLSVLYISALRAHLAETGENALNQAYELGRTALGDGVSVLDLVFLHHNSLSKLMLEQRLDEVELRLAGEFLAECLCAYDMALRGYQETNARLFEANADLRRATNAVGSAHQALKAEVLERERAEEALLHAKKLQAIGLLAGGVAHHFNNLLLVVIGNLDLAMRRIKAGDEMERFLVAARHGAERGAQVTRQLLTFSRQQKLEAKVVDTAAWAADIASLLESALRGDILVETDVATSVWPMHIDPVQLDLAILNLGVNARDAMPTGGVLHLSITNRQVDDERLSLRGGYVVIEVRDTGGGVAPDVLPRVFEPFFTTKTADPGTGLGLSQVHGFVNQSGGAVEMESVVGQGTTVRLYLPAAANIAATIPGSEPAAVAPASSGRLLVVDDDVDVADVAAELLQGCGYSVQLAHRGQGALDLLKAGEPVDLVFSDVMMPGGMSGIQLAHEVHRRFPALPILLTTGYSDAMAGAAAEGLPVITKPYRVEDLRVRIDQLLKAGDP